MKNKMNQYPRILLVEDRIEDVTLFQMALKEIPQHAEVLSFDTGAKLIQFLESTQNDTRRNQVIFMDINLPGQSGLEYLSKIKNHPLWKTIPVVIFTSSAASVDICEAYRSHANSYIQKPMEIEDFRQLVKIIGEYWLSAVTFSPTFVIGE